MSHLNNSLAPYQYSHLRGSSSFNETNSSLSTSSPSTSLSPSSYEENSFRQQNLNFISDVETFLEIKKIGKFEFGVLFLTGGTQFSDAMELLLVSTLSVELKREWNLNSIETSFLSVSVFLGMLIGAYSMGYIGDRYGRRTGVLLTLGLTSFFGYFSSFSLSLFSLIVSRFLVGIGIGGAPVCITLFTEFVAPTRRTVFLICFLFFFSFGAVVQSSLAYVVLLKEDQSTHSSNLSSSPSNLDNSYSFLYFISPFSLSGWRLLSFLSSFPSLFFLILSYFYLPESPRYLLIQGKKEEAKKTLISLLPLDYLSFYDTLTSWSLSFFPVSFSISLCYFFPWIFSQPHSITRVFYSPLQDLLIKETFPFDQSYYSETNFDPNSVQIQNYNLSLSLINHHNEHVKNEKEDDLQNENKFQQQQGLSRPVHKDSNQYFEVKNQFFEKVQLLFSSNYKQTTLLLSTLFFLMAVLYYSLILISLQISLQSHQHSSCNEKKHEKQSESIDEYRHDENRDQGYKDNIITTSAEFLGLFICLVLLDRFGRRKTISLMFFLTSLCVLSILFLPSLCSSSFISIDFASSSLLLLFFCRAFSLAFNQSLWIYTAEVFGTQVRSFGIGFVTSFARIGSILTPFLGNYLFETNPKIVFVLCVFLCILSSLLSLFLPPERSSLLSDF